MPGKVADIILVIALLALPMFGIIQACGNDGPIAPGSPGDISNGNGDGGDNGTPPPDNHAPVAVLNVVGDSEGPTPFTVHVDGTDSSDPDGDTLEYTWNFSDGGVVHEPDVHYEFRTSGRNEITLTVTDQWGLTDEAGPVTITCYGLANSAWPKFAHDIHNTGRSDNVGPMMNLDAADSGGAFSRYWRSGIENGPIYGICVGYEGEVIYTQGKWLRAKTSDGITLWDVEAESDITAWPAIAHDGSIIVGTSAGYVHRIGSDGTVIWSTDIRAEVGSSIRLQSAVTIDGNAQIYVGGLYKVLGHFQDGRLVSVDFDGNFLWSADVDYYYEKSQFSGPLSSDKIVPAITPLGEIAVNGEDARLLDSDGLVVADLQYIFGGYSTYPRRVGPPSIGPDGSMVFTQGRCPMFLQNGEFYQEIFKVYVFSQDHADKFAGGVQAPVWGSAGLSQIQEIDYLNDEHYLVLTTRTNEGNLHYLNILDQQDLPFTYSFRPYLLAAGASEDGSGTMYCSAGGLIAVSPLTYQDYWPFEPERYSLWSYFRKSPYMTAPVIGNDRWLYIGYGNDILAVGD